MSLWRQSLLSLVIIVAGLGLWARFYPGAGEILAPAGLGWLAAASTPPASGGGQGGGQGAGQGGRGPQGIVNVAQVTQQTINDRLSAIGTGRAVRSVEVRPFESGRMTEILVRSGAVVKRGDIIAKLDADAQEIAAERAEIALKDAEARLNRTRQLRQSNSASDVQVTDAELAADNARLVLREARLALSRRSVESPIDGIVGILPITDGNYVTSSSVIATVEDRSELLVDFWVPERFAGIAVGAPLRAVSVARPGEYYNGEVSAVDNRVETESRTLQVQATILNDGDRLRPGMSFQVEMRFPGETFTAVDPLAVQWGADGAFVWAVQDGKAKRTPVRIIQRNTRNVLVEAELKPGDEVVTEGLHLAREGAPLNIAGRQAPKPASDTAAKPAAAPSGS